MSVDIHLFSLTIELPVAGLGDELGAVAGLAPALLPLLSSHRSLVILTAN